MTVTIPITSLNGKQFMKARTLRLPVVIDRGVFRMPSSTGGEGEHQVRFDSQESPLMYSCTCKAGATGTPCWAAARALDALDVLAVNQIYVGGRGPEPAASVVHKGELPPRPLSASLDTDGALNLMVSATPLAGHVLRVP
jgi:hypothetical protein